MLRWRTISTDTATGNPFDTRAWLHVDNLDLYVSIETFFSSISIRLLAAFQSESLHKMQIDFISSLGGFLDANC